MSITIPDVVTVSRLLLTVPFAYLLFAGYGRWTLPAVYGLSAATDGLDGFLARRLGQVSPRGAWLDQMVDRGFTVAIVLLLLAHDWTGDRGFATGLPVLLALSCTREITGLVGVAIALRRKVPLYHVEDVGKVTTAIQSVALGVILLGVSWAVYPAIVCAVVGVFAGANYARYALSAATQEGPHGATGADWQAPVRGGR